MTSLGVVFLALSAATPASSIFVILPEVIAQAGSGALIAMALAALIAMSVSQVYAELGSAFPSAGGEYVMTSHTLGPLAGFMVLGLNFAATFLGTAVLALGVGEYLGVAALGLSPVVIAIATVAGATFLGILNIRTNAWITGAFVAVELGALVVVSGLGFAHPARPLADLLAHPAVLHHGAITPAGPASIALAMAVAVFAYDGYGSAVYFGEEMHDAPRRIGRAITWALLIVIVAEIAPTGALMIGAPDLKVMLAAPEPLRVFISALGGPALERGLGFAVSLAIINAVIAMVLLTSRQLYSTGRDGAWSPVIDGWLSLVHPKLQSPWPATLLAGAISGGLCLMPLKVLTVATGAGVAGLYAVLCIAVLWGRRSGATRHAHQRVPFYPWLPLVTLAALAGILAADWLDPDEGRPGLAISAAVALAFGLRGYFFLRRRSEGWLPRVPAS